MGRVIDKDTWRTIEIVISNYKTYKLALSEYEENIILSNTIESQGTYYDPNYTKPQSTTEYKALKLNSAYYKNLKRKIKAIEGAYDLLNEEERKVIAERFWTIPHKKIQYMNMVSVCYSEIQMKRIVNKMITLVGKMLGELP